MESAMGLSDEIAEKSSALVVRRGGHLLIKNESSFEFIGACEAAGVRILGIDVFQLAGESLVPDMSLIADFSDAKTSADSLRDARNFVSKIESQDLFLDISLSHQ